MKEIPNTGLLVSVHLSEMSSHLEVFDVSRKGKAKKVYSDEIVEGGRILVTEFSLVAFSGCNKSQFHSNVDYILQQLLFSAKEKIPV